MTQQFAVLHLQKGAGSGGGLGFHLDRSRKILNADPERVQLNKHVVVENGKAMPLNCQTL